MIIQPTPLVPGATLGSHGRRKWSLIALPAALLCLSFPSLTRAQESATPSAATADHAHEADMMKEMMEMGKTNANHKLLDSLDGNWSYNVKMWMNGDTSSKPMESHGTAVRKSVMGGRFVTQDTTGQMMMPGEDGKVKSMTFRGHSTEGYDNAKKKFVATWYDSTGTGIVFFDGSYDEATKTFTYNGDYQLTPEMSLKVRETLKLDDKNHMTLEWYETRGGQEMKTMEITYVRRK